MRKNKIAKHHGQGPRASQPRSYKRLNPLDGPAHSLLSSDYRTQQLAVVAFTDCLYTATQRRAS